MSRIFRGSLIALVLVGWAALAQDVRASDQLRRRANLATVTEALLSTASLARDLSRQAGNLGDVEQFAWTLAYSERDWVLRANGAIDGTGISVTVSGYLWGQDDESWEINYSGIGTMGQEPIFVSGKSEWHFDHDLADYKHVDFHHVLKVGDASHWAWVLGAEILAGGVIGGGAIVATIATGGGALGALAVLGGGVAGAVSLIEISEAIKHVEMEHPMGAPPPSPPPPPSRPSLPEEGEPIEPEEGMIVIVVSEDGQLKGSAPDGAYVLTGTFSDEKREAIGTITPR